MASQVPASSLLFLGVEARDKVPKDFIENIDQNKVRPELAPALESMTRQTGLDTVKMLKGFEPAGWAIVIDPVGKKNLKDAAIVGAVWVRDRKEAEACLADAAKKEKPQRLDVQGKSVETYKAGYSTCFSDPFLLVSNRSEGIRAVLQRQGPSLADDADFKAAHSQMFQNQSMAFFYSPASALDLAAPGDSKQAQEARGGLRFLAGGVASQSPFRSLAMLSLDPKSGSSFIKGLLTPPPSSNSLAASVPANWNLYMMMQLRYPIQAITEAAGWSPQGKASLKETNGALKGAGASAEQISKAFEGDLAVSLDLDKYFASMPSAPPNGVVMVGLRSPSDFEALWKGLCRSNGLKTQSQKVSGYQVDRLAELPYLMLARQNKQALLVLGKSPLEVLKTISNLKPGQSMKESPALKNVQQGGGLFALQYDLGNTAQQLKNSGLLGLSPQLAPLKDAIEHWQPEMWKGDMTVRIDKDGVKAEGAPVTMIGAAIFKFAILAAFLE